MMDSYSPAEYAALAAHGFRMLADAMEANLPYRIDCPALLFCGVHDRAASTKRYNRAWSAGEGFLLSGCPPPDTIPTPTTLSASTGRSALSWTSCWNPGGRNRAGPLSIAE